MNFESYYLICWLSISCYLTVQLLISCYLMCQTSVSGYLMFRFLYSEMFNLKFQLLWLLHLSYIFNTIANDILGIYMPRKTVLILKLNIYIDSLPMDSFDRGPLMWRTDCHGILYWRCLYLPLGFPFCHSGAMWDLTWPNHYWGPSKG